MALSALPPPLSAHCGPVPPAWPTLRTAATLHGPLSALPPPCMPRQGLISTVLFNRLWTAPHPLFVISGVLRLLVCTLSLPPPAWPSPLFPNTWSPHRPLSISGRMAALSAAPAWSSAPSAESPLSPASTTPHGQLQQLLALGDVFFGRSWLAALSGAMGVEPVTLPLRTRRSSCWATVITAYFHGEKLAAGRLLSRENKT
ncbi:hypothetical protein PAPYR_11798 [Paratrimastix pyriformis]|uniref:Uncharacterized protein n=1 Tax=Paratrimastix pyriformis TaxID=342808 RepID=A0ABQ8U5R0_9EUKA|nr:hypothetical protein PAPYR_11798 [Paratrimastix pyriformis]